ncbi:hypothetical protein vBVnaSL3_12 [Vibrio phage vB_VnaS-L3]|nr:hypothetical protein vBVnaSL3_12 [Vibrio phage vB_VnaS-L3]
MMELMFGVLVIGGFAIFSMFMLILKEREERKELEDKVRAHEAMQEIESDIVNGGDAYITEQLRQVTRDL